MVGLKSSTDLVQRRTAGCMGRDGVEVCYATLNADKTHVNLTFVLKDDIPPAELTKLAVRYQHLFSDYLDEYSVKVLPRTNYFKKDKDTYSIWNCRTGFDI